MIMLFPIIVNLVECVIVGMVMMPISENFAVLSHHFAQCVCVCCRV